MRRFHPIPFTEVQINDSFWDERLRINREISIPYQYRQCKETGRIDAFKLDWKPGQGRKPSNVWDSDVAKWVEAASYSLATHPDPVLEKLLDETVALIASSQQPDGYLNSYYSQVEQDCRWTNLRDRHELYCAGHLIEAGVAHFQATGKRTLLDAVCRYADYIGSVFGREEGKKRGYCGHEEIELALVKLYRATGERRYLELSSYFVEERGQQPLYFALEAQAHGHSVSKETYFQGSDAYFQAHLPVREQKEAVGHAVRALYLYSAMTDLAAELEDSTLLDASLTLWESVTRRRMYLTGGVGSARQNEGFTKDYDLPNETAYCETCAAVALILWSHRLLQFHCDGQYADVMERALYNGVLSGVSFDGTKFFYENPLTSLGNRHREEWFECSCCPSNLARLLASLGNYVFSSSGDSLAVHLYLQCKTSKIAVANTAVQFEMATRYPWEGSVRLTVNPERDADFAVRLRIPKWCRSYKIRVQGRAVEAHVENGYAVIFRTWSSGDIVKLELDMPVEKIAAHPSVLMNQGRIALQRGPLVYCIEDANCETSVLNLALEKDAKLQARWNPDLLHGITVIEGFALASSDEEWERALYRPVQAVSKKLPFLAIPYFAWDNQKPGAMTVWIPGNL